MSTDHSRNKEGVTVKYHNEIYKKKIKIIVNPSKLLNGDDFKLWKPNDGNISNLIDVLGTQIDDYFNSDYRLDDFKLTRMDFTVDINTGSNKNVYAYIKVLQKLGKVKGYSQKFNKDNELHNNDRSFDLVGNSNGIEFTAYDKEAELKQREDDDKAQNAKGILRIEVRLKKQKAIRKYTKETVTSMQITDLSKQSREIFWNTIVDIVPFGDFYKLKEAEEIIRNSPIKKSRKMKMLRLMGLIPEKKSLQLAQKELDVRNVDDVMDWFAELNISPVTISKRQKINYLKNLYNYLEID